MQPQTILDRIAELPRIQLARKNTPFEEMPRLRAAIADSMGTDISAVPPLFIKRDDTTGFAFGGNKARHMEFMFAHFIERGIDTVVNINHYDSNNARMIAAACAKTGIKCHLVSFDHIDEPVIGNLLIGHLSGAEIHRVPKDDSRPLAEELLATELDAGHNATIVSDNPFFDIAGMIGFLEVGAELDTQITRHSRPLRHTRVGGYPEGQGEGERADNPFPHASNTSIHIWGLCGRSIGGIRLYARNTGKPWTATAVAQQLEYPTTYEGIYLDRSSRVSKLLGLDTALDPGDITTIAGYTGTYGYPTEASIAAIHLVASTEGIMLDPNYTGKSMSGLIDQIRLGNVDPETPIVFIHSGGLPQTFAFADQLWNWQP